jgi:hypothetical protein
MKTQYSYGLVRYVHDVVTEEFVNVGVVLYAPGVRFLQARCTRRYGRASKFFGGVNGNHILSTLAHVERVLDSESRSVGGLSFDRSAADAFEVIRSVFVIDDSSLQFVAGGGGLTRNPEATLEELYERFIGRYEPEPRPRRKDDDVWRDVKKSLDATGVSEQLQSYRVDAPLRSYEFAHAVKNGKWHAIEPVSFDLMDAHSLTEKAEKWAGRTHSLRDAAANVRILYVTASPSEAKLASAYRDALGILRLSAIEHEIFDEKQAGALAEELRQALEVGQ